MALEEQFETGLHHPAKGGPPRTWRSWFIGRPLAAADAPHQTIGKAIGLAVFASDALSSTAYATQEILFILAVAGTAAFSYAFSISIAIVILLAIVTISYEQTIHAYSNGGGAYITVVVPQFVPRHWWHNLLHTQTAFWLYMSLLFGLEIVVTDVPYLIR